MVPKPLCTMHKKNQEPILVPNKLPKCFINEMYECEEPFLKLPHRVKVKLKEKLLN